ncbi:zinc-dependent metalloprotease [Amycolatopsis sp. FDAARGOS 1241]|uniref:zinc-dependent metalloprotease n=1 Tax=Amycolatopsis sp. FDAARGOS 1241 TaxID=2778070 RepID=UPI001951EDB3|nr:zinc-dependent metalloprotease [Amycolatopsis sp. FDAARGOS 1241]QRP50511.1 zinc-dependent metalloprotease [Amycolatopsis sp. FDAARGOS 1241]
MVDWDLAASTGARLVRGGPQVPKEEAARAVTDLRDLTAEAESHVREVTGLGEDLPLLPGTVVDRPGWVRSAASGLGALTGRALPEAQGGPLGPILASGAGVQTGLVLAFLASRVLGQYDPFGGPEREGQLLLVAPNVVAAERAMKVHAPDFRLWVCLHECTHRLQFTAVRWLRDYFADEVERLVTGIAGHSADGLSDLVGRLPDALKQRGKGVGLAELLQSPKERAIFDRLLALSTLLEGHADYVMDAVGPRVVPTVETIRSRFSARRQSGGVFDRLLRALLGLDAKIRQYEEGAKFTKHVVDAVGMAGFNAVWRSPNTLPTRAEISDPAAWVRRLHG